MKKLFILLCGVFIISSSLLGQTMDSLPQTKIMTLGVFHFAYHNLDAVKTENKDKISGLGWEKLLLLDYQKYSPICNWKSLKNLNFKILKKVYPEIEQFKSVL